MRRARERGFEDFGWTGNWLTFSFANYDDPEWVNFGPLRVMAENHIQPRSGFPLHPHRDVEIVTYGASGTLTHGDNQGFRADIESGEMQRISAGSRGVVQSGMVHSEENHRDVVEHDLQMWLVPDRAGTTFAHDQKRFTPEERRGRLRLYVSPDGRDGSMNINTDAAICAGLFAKGDRPEHLLAPGRGAWVRVVVGQVAVAGVTLSAGDGLGVENAETLGFTFGEASELLLFGVRMDVPLLWR